MCQMAFFCVIPAVCLLTNLNLCLQPTLLQASPYPPSADAASFVFVPAGAVPDSNEDFLFFCENVTHIELLTEVIRKDEFITLRFQRKSKLVDVVNSRSGQFRVQHYGKKCGRLPRYMYHT